MSSSPDYMRKWRAANRDKLAVYHARHRSKPGFSAHSSDYQRSYRLRSKYGLSVTEYERMSHAQFGVCAICHDERKLVVDHCHSTGEVRGLLCSPCNTAIGLLRDDPATVQRAVGYISGRHNMATFEARGYCNKPELKTSAKGVQYCKFTLAVQQKRRDKMGAEIVEKLYVNCTDFDPKNIPSDGEYLGVTGYITISKWAANGKDGINLDLSVKSYEKLEQKARTGGSPVAAKTDAAPPSDPFALSPGKP